MAQPTKFGQPDEKAAPGQADQAAGGRILAEFRRAGIAGDHWLAFELRVMPRKAAERTVTGTLRGTRGAVGPVSRLEVGPERWLIESGPQSAAWQLTPQGQVRELAPTEAGQALAGTGVTVFDLQMPFLYWEDFTYEGEAKVRGRPTHSFILHPPTGTLPPVPGLTGVRVLIDTQFQAMVQAELLGAKNVVEKTISLLDLKKMGERYIVKSIDVRNNLTRDKTRFTVTAAALELSWPAEIFLSANLATEAPPVPAGQVVRF